jgi:pSer/pThr/pTyr-binding forkhead associated (FHA) protein
MLRRKVAPEEAPTAASHATAGREYAGQDEYDIVLTPKSHPDLGDIRIDEGLFAIGRAEAPFASYASNLIVDLSRRHARIFCESGAVYIADLNSKNGTTVNGVEIRQKTSRLRDGDEVCFGRTLCYRVQLSARLQTRSPSSRLVSLTLTPEHSDLGVQPIVVTQFPFLIGKADPTFSRYKDEYPHQVNYLSRRHAHIFLKGGAPYVEDLGSTNGTFIAGKRLDEHSVALREGDVIAFGGHHFVYKVSLQEEQAEVEPTHTKLSPVRSAPDNAANADKTTFVAAADSFLDIFCVDQAPQQDDEVNNEAVKPADDAVRRSDKRRARGRTTALLSEIVGAFGAGERSGMKRAAVWAAALGVVLGTAAFLAQLESAPERELKDLLGRGDHAQAAVLAEQYVKGYPDNAEIKALGTEAQLKTSVPKWLAMLKARQFEQAAALIVAMKQGSSNNADAQSLINEMEWMGNLQRFVIGRGGADAPIRIYGDEETIKSLLKRWEEDSQGHQRALARIASYVPEFKDPYTEALSHLRKLQSDDSVYLGAIERLKAAIETELNRNGPEALESILKEYSDKYPRLGGLDTVRQDLRQYMEVESEARARNLGPLVNLLGKARFSTPPFQQRFRSLSESDRLPPANVIQQYQAVAAAWREGNTTQALEGLQKMNAGPWADAAARELERKKALMEQFTELQKARGAKGYDERLLTFYASLRSDEDVFLVRAIQDDIGVYKGKALQRAQELFIRAQDQWRQYRANGAIEGRQRLEGSVSNHFRVQAGLLSRADQDAQQGIRIVTQLKADQPAEWNKVRDEIHAEAELQRKSLMELRSVLEPGLLKTKLALLGTRSDDERQSPKTVN